MNDGRKKTLNDILHQEIRLKECLLFFFKSKGRKPKDESSGLLSRSSKPDKIRISRQEVEDFVLLGQSGLKIRDSVTLAFLDPEPILAALENGKSLSGVLCDGQKGRFFCRLRDLQLVSELPQALDQALSLEKGSGRLMETLLKNAAYPLFLMFFSWLLLWFFALNILPMMSVYSQDGDFLILYVLLGVFTLFWLLLFLAAFFRLLSMLFPARFQRPVHHLTVFLCSKSALLQKICSYQLTCLLLALLCSGVSTKEAIGFLGKMKSAGLFGRRAEIWLSKMERGASFEDCLLKERILDPVFLKFVQTGFETGRINTLLSSYQKQVLTAIEGRIRKMSVWIQCLSYGCVGLLCISVYQVMLSPLNMLSTM